MSLFRAAQKVAAGVVRDVFGDTFTLQPMKQSAGRWGLDPDRPVISLSAILTEKSAVLDQIGERGASGMSKGVASQSATTLSTIDFHLADVPYRVTKGDRFVDDATGNVYEVMASPATDLADVCVRVARLGAPL